MFAAMAADAGRVRRSPILGLLGGLLGGGHHHHHEPIHHHHHDHHGIQITKYTFKHRCCLIPSFPYLMRTPWIAFNYFFNMLTVNIIIWFENNTRERRKELLNYLICFRWKNVHTSTWCRLLRKFSSSHPPPSRIPRIRRLWRIRWAPLLQFCIKQLPYRIISVLHENALNHPTIF